VDPFTAVLGFLGNAVGGVAGYFTADRQASAAENVADAQRDAKLAWFKALVKGWDTQAHIDEMKAWFGRDVAWIEGDTQRTRIFYNYRALAAMRGVVISLAGVALLGLAVYLSEKGAEK
jgi:hypothetical protein